MRIDIVTVFPEMAQSALDYSIVKRASEKGLVTINVINLRDYTFDRHRTTDDTPYGGGGGMVMKVEPIGLALDAVSASANPDSRPPRVLLTEPRGRTFNQEMARELATEDHIVILCGHYEGVDDRVRQLLVTDEVSLGDFILTGGELPALVIADAITRLQTGALGDAEAPDKDTFSNNLLEYPHYTRPVEYRGVKVPDILLSGHHAQIEKWRRWHQLNATRTRRPDLFAKIELSAADKKLIDQPEPQAPEGKKKTPVNTA
jgi:tRNA (guanine37-N1)-methyltransferase